MHLVKWIRKNNRKIMTFVVVFIMLSFVVGQFGIKMIVGLMGGGPQLIATYDNGKKIKSPEFVQAQNELTVLRMLMADRLLLAQSRGGFSGPLLSYLLFPDSQFSSEIASQMKQLVQRGQLQISMDELDNFFLEQRERPEILWILLKQEAYQAGCIMPNASAAQTLRYAIPQMTNNQFDGAGLVSQIISKNNISEDQILRIFADLLSVLSYAGNVMDNESVTINQIKSAVGRSKEKIDAEYAKIAAEPFINETAEVADSRIQEQFEQYKAVSAGTPGEDNPFGFGYRLPKRVQLEYIIVQMDDVKKRIEKPSPEALEEYYSNHLDVYQVSKPSDPNNPESEKITRTQTFAEVENRIRRELENEKTNTQANIIFNDIKDKTETGFETINFDEATLGQLQKAAGDYEAVSKTLAEKYQVPMFTGKTGWLNADRLAQDEILSRLGLRRGQNYLPLPMLAMTVTEEKSPRQRIGIPAIRVWENIGPMDGGFYSQQQNKYIPIMALVRVVDIKEAQVSETVDVEFNIKGVSLSDELGQDEMFSLKEEVREDILLLDAMSTAEDKAEELSALVNEKGWEDAIKAYNDKYAPGDPNMPNPQAIKLDSVKQQLRRSLLEIDTMKRYMLENPAAAQYIQQQLTSSMLTNELYTLLPEDTESTGIIQTVLPYEAQEAFLVVKEVQRQPATTKDYMDNKAQMALQLSTAQSASLAMEYFSSEKILQRMNYQPELDAAQPAEPTKQEIPVEDSES
jgi:hypothetical protein